MERAASVFPAYTANRAVNAVPVVCAAAPGIRTTFDLPQVIAALGRPAPALHTTSKRCDVGRSRRGGGVVEFAHACHDRPCELVVGGQGRIECRERRADGVER